MTATTTPSMGQLRNVLVVGASGDIGYSLLQRLSGFDLRIGAHYHSNEARLRNFAEREHDAQLKLLQANAADQSSCHALIEEFVGWAGGIDGLVQLSGDVAAVRPWTEVTEDDWNHDLSVNLSGPFFLAQSAMHHMGDGGGRVLLTSTASAIHGGGPTSMAYGAAKAAVECLTKGLAREGAPQGILVNAVAPGLIETKFHTQRMKRDITDLEARAKLVPLNRAGTPDEVAGIYQTLLSPLGNYITGQVISVSGGDWL